MAVPDAQSLLYYRKRKAFCGSIQCLLSALRFEDITIAPRQYDHTNVSRLVQVFKDVGCKRPPEENHVAALISTERLQQIREEISEENRGGRKAKDQDMQSVSRNGLSLLCLQGRHRIEAAKRFLHPDDRWWMVDLYKEEDLGQAERDKLREEYSNSKNFFDGDIFRHIRLAVKVGDLAAKRRWQSKLSITKRRDVRLLEERALREPQTGHLQDRLDHLLPFTGLWRALQIGTFHRILSLRCPEELVRYVGGIHIVWTNAIPNPALQGLLDADTVSAVEGLCPKLSQEDALLFDQKKGLFSRFPDSEKASAIERLRSAHHMIPSLHTFLEDTKLLEPCAKILKKLLPTPCRTTIYQELNQLHNEQTSWLVQLGENKNESRDERSSEIVRANSYRQLWLYAFRHFPEMMCQPLRKDPSRRKPPTPTLELVWWYKLTELAMECGYTSIDQTYSKSKEADAQMFEMFITHVRPSLLWRNYGVKTDTILKMLNYLDRHNLHLDATDSTDLGDYTGLKCGPEIAFRCGIPFEEAYREDQKALFLACIDRPPSPGLFLGSFHVKRHIFLGFFGPPPSFEPLQPQGNQQTENPHNVGMNASSPVASSNDLRGDEDYLPEIETDVDPFSSTVPPALSSTAVDTSPVVTAHHAEDIGSVRYFDDNVLNALVHRLYTSSQDPAKFIVVRETTSGRYEGKVLSKGDNNFKNELKDFCGPKHYYWAPVGVDRQTWSKPDDTRPSKRNKQSPEFGVRIVRNESDLTDQDFLLVGLEIDKNYEVLTRLGAVGP